MGFSVTRDSKTSLNYRPCLDSECPNPRLTYLSLGLVSPNGRLTYHHLFIPRPYWP
jgi:hypothetical protein